LEAVPVMQAAEQGVSRSAHGMWLRVPGRARASPRAAGCGGCGGGALVVAEVLTQDALGFSLPPSCLPPRHPRFLRVAPCCPDLRVPRGFRESLVKRRPKKGALADPASPTNHGDSSRKTAQTRRTAGAYPASVPATSPPPASPWRTGGRPGSSRASSDRPGASAISRVRAKASTRT
jgi:hypothetical protein